MMRIFLCVLSVCAIACQPAETTPLSEVVIQIDADELVQQAGDTLFVEIASGPNRNELEESTPEEFDLTAPTFSWPVTITLVAKPAHESHVFELNLRLEKDGVVLARGRVQSGFAKGRTLVLQKSLGAQCLGMLDCPDNETCVVENGRATCKSAAVDPEDLPTEIPMRDAGTMAPDAGDTGDAGMTTTDAGPGMLQDAATSDASFSDASGCIATGAEDCMNGLDDDCNGAVDCADSACEPVTQCVPESLAYVLVGIDEACPAGYWELDVVHQDLKDNGCEGCSCTPVDKECEAYLRVYSALTPCAGDSTGTGGTLLRDPVPETCSAPVGKAMDLANGFNVQIVAGKNACEASGEPKPSAPEWGNVRKRCSAELHSGGCVLGYCAPRPEAQDVCWPETDAGCGALVTPQTFFQNYDDTRVCEACSCTTTGGSCSDVGVIVSTDPTCRTGS
ncbi:MAG TPA: hypothetical protein VMF89_30030, partial [Polyangiales bacterium]|nr:hypothetical protein [Polyangiales bacterium]